MCTLKADVCENSTDLFQQERHISTCFVQICFQEKLRHLLNIGLSLSLLSLCTCRRGVSLLKRYLCTKCVHIGGGTRDPKNIHSYLGHIFKMDQETPTKIKQPTNGGIAIRQDMLCEVFSEIYLALYFSKLER